MADKFINVDILQTLHKILLANTEHYRSDFYTFDIQYFWKMFKSGKAYEKQILWMCRPSGTWCLSEHDVFIKESSGHALWLYYQEQSTANNLPYFVHLKEVVDGRLMGDIYELDYKEHYTRVKKKAVEGQACIHYADGDVLQPFGKRVQNPHPDLGTFINYESVPKESYQLEDVLCEEVTLRNKNKIGNIETHTKRIKRNRKK